MTTSRHRLNRVIALLGLQPGEERLVWSMMPPYFLLGAAIILFETATFALFLATYDAETLPLIYVVNAIGVGLTSFVYLRLSERFSFVQRLAGSLIFLLGLAALFYAGLITFKAAWLVFALPIGYEVLKNLSKVTYWGLAIRVFDIRQGKRLFGLIGAGRWVAIILVGLLIPALVEALGTISLLLLAAVSLLVATVLLLRTANTLTHLLTQPESGYVSLQTQTQKSLWSDPYILLIFGLIILWFIASFFIDNLFFNQAVRQFPDEAQLASFLGIFGSVRGGLTLFTTTVLSKWTNRRLGIRVSLLMLPLSLLTLVVAASFVHIVMAAPLLLFWLTVVMKGVDKALGDADEQSTLSILYQPLRARLRDQAQTVAGGIVKPLAIGLAGVLLLALDMSLGTNGSQLLPILLGIVTAWTIVALWLGRGYVRALMQALTKRWLGAFSPELTDSHSLRVIKQALNSERPEVVTYALHLLGDVDPPSQAAVVSHLLSHTSAEVRRVALLHIEQMKIASALPQVRTLIDVEPDPDVRGQAVCVYAALGGTEAFPVGFAFVDDPNPLVRMGALVGLLRNFGVAGRLSADKKLKQLATDPDLANRVFAAQVIERVGHQRYYTRLIPLLDDPNVAVQRAALIAAGAIQHPDLWPMVIVKLSSPQVEAAATAALVAGGEDVLDRLYTTWTLPNQSWRVLERIAQVYGRIGSAGVLPFLRNEIDHPVPSVRTQVLRALHRCGYHPTPAERSGIQQQIRAEVAVAAWLCAAQVDLRTLSAERIAAIAVLHETLAADFAQAQRRLLYFLSFLHDPETIAQIRRNLNHSTAEKRAYAIELLDLTVTAALKPLILPILEPIDPEQCLQQLRLIFPEQCLQRTPAARLQEIMTGPATHFSPWIKATAFYIARKLGQDDLQDMVQQTLVVEETSINETTAWGLGQQLAHTETVSVAQRELMTIEKVAYLKAARFFAHVPSEGLFVIAEHLAAITVAAGTTLIEQGRQHDHLYLIVDGTVQVCQGDRVIRQLQHGDTFGEMTVLSNGCQLASVIASVDTRLLCLDRTTLLALLDNRIDLARGILNFLSQTLRNQNHTLRKALAPM